MTADLGKFAPQDSSLPILLTFSKTYSTEIYKKRCHLTNQPQNHRETTKGNREAKMPLSRAFCGSTPNLDKALTAFGFRNKDRNSLRWFGGREFSKCWKFSLNTSDSFFELMNWGDFCWRYLIYLDRKYMLTGLASLILQYLLNMCAGVHLRTSWNSSNSSWKTIS